MEPSWRVVPALLVRGAVRSLSRAQRLALLRSAAVQSSRTMATVWASRLWRHQHMPIEYSRRLEPLAAYGDIAATLPDDSYRNNRRALAITTSVLPSWTRTAGAIPKMPVVVARMSTAMTAIDSQRFC